MIAAAWELTVLLAIVLGVLVLIDHYWMSK